MKDNTRDITDVQDFFLSEDDKYGGLKPNNLKEALNYFQVEKIQTIKNKQEELLNNKIECDYHNTYYLGKGKYGFRQLKLKS